MIFRSAGLLLVLALAVTGCTRTACTTRRVTTTRERG